MLKSISCALASSAMEAERERGETNRLHPPQSSQERQAGNPGTRFRDGLQVGDRDAHIRRSGLRVDKLEVEGVKRGEAGWRCVGEKRRKVGRAQTGKSEAVGGAKASEKSKANERGTHEVRSELEINAETGLPIAMKPFER